MGGGDAPGDVWRCIGSPQLPQDGRQPVWATKLPPESARRQPAIFYTNPEAIRKSDWHLTPGARKRRREKNNVGSEGVWR